MTDGVSLRPSPSQDVLQLVHALGRAEWGPLASAEFRGARVVLEALASIMWSQRRGRSATVIVTAKQIADRAAYSPRWTRTSLHRLEDAGIVVWERGGVIDGSPQPGHFKIVKSVLCDWIAAARTAHDEAMRRYIEETRKRLRALIYRTIRPRLRRSDHAEATSNLPPYRGRKGAGGAPLRSTPHLPTKNKETPPMATLPEPASTFLPLVCVHSLIHPDPGSCNACRSKALQDYQEAERLAEQEAARKRAEQRRKDEADEAAKGTAFVNYMTTTYPNHRRADWGDLIAADPIAKELVNA